MANLELDPVFLRALRHLQAKSKDSADQLRAMLDEAIGQRHGGGVRISAVGSKKDLMSKMESSSAKSRSASPAPLVRKDDMRLEGEKRTLDKLKDELSELNQMSKDPVNKRLKLVSPKTIKSHTPSPTSSRDSDSYSKKSEDSDSNEDDLAKEIMMGLNCVVCKRLEVGPRNQLVECQDCHSLYHQECHVPPIPQDLNDPRVVWYCANCTKDMKKQASKSSKTASGKQSRSTASRESPVPTKASLKAEAGSHSNLFKRVESKNAPVSSSGSSAISCSKPMGMAALAASLKGGAKPPQPISKFPSSSSNGKSATFGNLTSGKAFGGASSLSKPNNNNSSSTTSPAKPTLPPPNNSKTAASNTGGTSSILIADKRLQIMKKKAAKMQEKKKLAK